jgi:hypothetical protein
VDDLDMPHPLSHVRRNAEVEVYPYALRDHPDFALIAMEVIALWADIDGNLAGVLANMLRTDIEAGAAIYEALSGGQSRRAALLAVATTMPKWQQLLLHACLQAVKPSRDQRNDFAHHVWGRSKDVANALLLMPPDVVTKRNVSLRQRVEHLPDGRGVIAPQDFDRARIMVYRRADFERARRGALEATGIIGNLYGAIGVAPTESARRALLNEPLVQQALESLIPENDPVVQAQLRPPGDDPPAPGISEHWDRILGRIP